MDRVTGYRQILEEYLTEQASIPFSPNVNLSHRFIADKERDEYLLLTIGTHRQKRVHQTVIHLSIKDEKVLLLEFNGDWEILEHLVELGIAREDLVDTTQSYDHINQ